MDEAVVFSERGRSVVAGGTQLGSKYLLGEQLGRGAMGVVYDATTADGASLAVKLLRPELASDDKTVARFVQERQIFRRIDHPNVVRVDDLVAEGDQLGIAMEKVSGGDLKQRAEARSLAPATAMQVAADVAAGLEAIHAADVVHRDLKPANILLAETPGGLQPKISDFGISRLVSETMTRTSTTIGTPLYMAPEAADKRGADAPADIYSLGAMMFELLIGNAPFHGGGTFAVLRAHAQDLPPLIGGVPVELADLIDHMLAKEPSARPNAGDVRRRLLDIIPSIDDAVHSPIAIERTIAGTGVGATTGAGAGAAAAAVGVSDAAGGALLNGAAGNATAAGIATAAGVAGTAVASGTVGAVAGAAGVSGTVGAVTGAAGVSCAAGAAGVAGAAVAASDSAALVAAGGASDSAETRFVDLNGGQPSDSAETRISSEGFGGPPTPGNAGIQDCAATHISSDGLTRLGSAKDVDHSDSVEARISSDGIRDFEPPASTAAASPYPGSAGGAAVPGARRVGAAGGRGAVLLNRLPRRWAEVGVAVASLVAVLAVVGFVATRGDDQASAISSEGEISIEADDGSDGSTTVSDNQNQGDQNPGGPGIFDGRGGGDGDGVGTTDTTASGATSTTVGRTSTSGGGSTTAAPTSTTEAPTTSSTTSSSSSTSSSTTEPTTTTSTPTTTTAKPTTTAAPTTTTAPTPTPIAIVSTPTVDSVGPTSFHFNYTTNNVCGTGSFTVSEKASGTPVGSFTGQNICYGPLHGGFPGHSSFPGFNLEPGTTYKVSISVKGTATDGARPAGSGTAYSSFEVTTAG